MSTPRKPQAERLVEAHAHDLASELIRTGGEPRRASFEIEDAGGWRIIVCACPACELPDWLSPCEADIVKLLHGRAGPLMSSRVLAELDRRARDKRGEWHGPSTVAHALAHLRKEGVLTNSRVAPRGYELASRYQPRDAASDVG